MPLVIWTLLGIAFYLFEKRRGRLENFDYQTNLTALFSLNDREEMASPPLPEGV